MNYRENGNGVDPYELRDNPDAPNAPVGQIHDGAYIENRNQLDPFNLEDKKESSNNVNSQENQINGMFTEFKKLNQGDKSLRKNNINTFINSKSIDVDAFITSPAYEKLLREARNGGYNTQDKSKAMKMNFALQIYARQELGDQNIAIDGESGPQTLTVLRFIQTDGIAGDALNVQVTEAQQKKFAEYRAYRGGRVLERSSLIVESPLSAIIPKSNNEVVPKKESESTILSTNNGIENSINNLPKPDTLRINTEEQILDEFEIKNLVNKNIEDPSIANPCIKYIVNNRQGDLPEGITPALDKSIKRASLEKKQSVSSLCQRESYLSCIKGFEGLLRNFTSDPVEKESWIKALDEQSESSFDTVKLSLEINIGGETIRFTYDTEKGEILANALIYKDPKTNKISTIKKGTFSPIISKIPTRASIEQSMQGSINKKIQSKLVQTADFQDAIKVETDVFNTKLINNTNLAVIKKTVESNYTHSYLLQWMQEHGQENNIRKEFTQKDNSDLYKTFDILSRTLNNDETNIGLLRSKLKDIHGICTEYQTKDIRDERSTPLSKESLEEESTGKNKSYGLYMLFTQCSKYTGLSSQGYRVMDITEMEKLINHHRDTAQDGFGPITHQEILSHKDTTTASHDADKLLESAFD